MYSPFGPVTRLILMDLTRPIFQLSNNAYSTAYRIRTDVVGSNPTGALSAWHALVGVQHDLLAVFV